MMHQHSEGKRYQAGRYTCSECRRGDYFWHTAALGAVKAFGDLVEYADVIALGPFAPLTNEIPPSSLDRLVDLMTEIKAHTRHIAVQTRLLNRDMRVLNVVVRRRRRRWYGA